MCGCEGFCGGPEGEEEDAAETEEVGDGGDGEELSEIAGRISCVLAGEMLNCIKVILRI